jgi:hypothetical protein
MATHATFIFEELVTRFGIRADGLLLAQKILIEGAIRGDNALFRLSLSLLQISFL